MKNAADLEGVVPDATKNAHDKKRSRQEKDSHYQKKPPYGVRNSDAPLLEKALAAGSSLRDAGLDSGVLGERPGAIMIEIGPEARWNLGDQQPLQAFGAFCLDWDAKSYEGFSWEEIASRSRRRLGMFISDYERLLVGVEEEAKVAREREVAGLRRELREANQKLCDMAGREEEAARRLEVEEKRHVVDEEKFKKQVADLEEEFGRCHLNGDGFQRERDESRASNIALVNEVEALKKTLAEANDELIQILAGGYNAFWSAWLLPGWMVSGTVLKITVRV